MKLGYFLSSEELGPAELYVNQIGPEQEGFFAAYRDGVLPRYAD